MILLTSTSDVIRVVTGSAVSTITVHASWVDNASGTITPGRTNTNITTAATTTVVASPGASTQRNVKTIAVTNNNASASCQVTVQHFDGTTSTDLMGVTLLAGENLYLLEDGDWQHHNSQGAEYAYTAPAPGTLGPTGAIAETFPRTFAVANSAIGASGTLFLQSIFLTAGQVVSNIGMISATTAAATTTNLQFGLYSSALVKLAESADQGAYTWAANTVRTLPMISAYTVPQSGLYYIALKQVATTIATLQGGPAKANAIVASTAPILHGTSTTGLTTTLPSTAAAITAGTPSLYAWVT